MSTHAIPSLAAEKRERTGSRYALRAREQGQLPAVIYGHGQDPVSVSLNAKETWEVLLHHAHLVNVQLDGQTESCLVKAVQWDHLGANIIHVDLARVDLSEEVEVEVGIEFVGEPKAIATPGSVLNHERDALWIKTRADNIPETITVDQSQVNADSPLTVADIPMPEGVVCIDDPETVVVSIATVAELPEGDDEAGAGAEPEVIGRKEDGEGNSE